MEKQLDAIAADVKNTKQMQKASERASYLRKQLKKRLQYMPRTPSKGGSGDFQGRMSKKSTFKLPSGLPASKKKFDLPPRQAAKKIADKILKDIISGKSDSDRFVYEQKMMRDMGEGILAAGINKAFTPLAFGIGGFLGGALGSMAGPVGGSIGGLAGAKISMKLLSKGSQRFAKWWAKQSRKKMTETEVNNAIKDDRRNYVAYAVAAGGIGQYLWNRLNPVPVSERWRGPHHEAAIVQGMLPDDMRNLVARAMAANPVLAGESSAPGDPLGSFRTFLYRMAYMNP